MLKNKSILLPKEESDGIRVCVMNSIHPEYEFDIWLPCLAPSRDLIEQYVISQTINWDEFIDKYQLEQENQKSNIILLSLADLIAKSEKDNHNVTLLCFEEEIDHCHRQIITNRLLKIINNSD